MTTPSDTHDRDDDAPGDGEREDERSTTATDEEARERAADGEEASLEEQLAAKDELIAEKEDKVLRAMAELQNVRRRANLDVDDARRYGSAPLLTELLSAIDNLQRALAHPPEGTDQGFLDGLALIEQSLLATLADHGVSSVDAQRGQTPDPTVHRVLLEQEDSELEPGRITAEIVRGYRLHDRLLREAQVAVSKAPAADDDGED